MYKYGPTNKYNTHSSSVSIQIAFSIYIVDILHKQWKPGRTQNPHPRVFTINEDSKAFQDHFDQVQEQLETLTSMDNLLSGTLHPLLYLFCVATI